MSLVEEAIRQQKVIKVGKDIDFGELHDKLCEIAKPLLLKVLQNVNNWQIQKQDVDEITYAPKITKDDLIIDWNKTAEEIHNRVRALAPFPGARAEILIGEEKRILKIFKVIVMKNME